MGQGPEGPVPAILRFFSGQDVGHVVYDSLLLGDDPLGGHDGAADEDLPGVGLMAELDALGVADEHHGVVSDDVPSSDGVDPDLLPAGADAFAAVDELLSAQFLADDLGGGHGGPAGGVLLLVVMGFYDLHMLVLT